MATVFVYCNDVGMKHRCYDDESRTMGTNGEFFA